MKEFADFAGNLIKKRTRLGRGVPFQGAESQRLKPLSERYKQQRRGLRTINKSGTALTKRRFNPDLSTDTQPAKSNLTYTGQLLDSISSRGKDGEGDVFMKNLRSDSSLTNNEIAEFVQKDRPFFNLSRAEISQLQKKIRDIYAQNINSILKKLN